MYACESILVQLQDGSWWTVTLGIRPRNGRFQHLGRETFLAFDIAVSTKISFTPTADNEEAGLVVRADDKNHYDLVITRQGGKRVVMLRKCLKNEIVSTGYGSVYLKWKSNTIWIVSVYFLISFFSI
ncbi:MAG: hypothetical protein LBL58_03075 [Tannerellaceae bacterium]|nr:hypothetical protein [Tannerellaceae bacterium]